MLIEPLFQHAATQGERRGRDRRHRPVHLRPGGRHGGGAGPVHRLADAERQGRPVPAHRRRLPGQFLRNAVGPQDGRADQLPPRRAGDRPHHQGQRHRHRPDRPAAGWPRWPTPAEGDRSDPAAQAVAGAGRGAAESAPAPGRARRPGRLDVHQRHQRHAQGRDADLRQPGQRHPLGHPTRRLEGKHKFLGILPLFHSHRHAGHAAGPGAAGVAGGLHGPVQPRGRAQGRPGARDQRHHRRAQHVRRRGQGAGRQARGLEERSTPASAAASRWRPSSGRRSRPSSTASCTRATA